MQIKPRVQIKVASNLEYDQYISEPAHKQQSYVYHPS